MQVEHVKVGSLIGTVDGALRIDSRSDAGLFYCTEYTYVEDMIGECKESGTRVLTKSELEEIMFEANGGFERFKIVFDD